jgi:ABC-type antimicrobial peptide transport system permease subunit
MYSINVCLLNQIKPKAFVTYTIFMQMYTQILGRTRLAPLTVLHRVLAEVQAVNKDQQVFRTVRNLEQWITTQTEWQQERLVTILFGAFSVLALIISAVGLYSVVSYSVAQRTPEFGIRMALGAQQGDVLRNVLTSMGVSVGSGFGAGILLSLALSGVIAQWVEGGSANPLTLLAVLLLLVLACAAAIFWPARRAVSVEPMAALRYE